MSRRSPRDHRCRARRARRWSRRYPRPPPAGTASPIRRRAIAAETPPAPAASRCRHRPRAPRQNPAAGSRRNTGGGNQPLGLALGRAEGGAVLIGRAGDGDVNEPNRAAAVADRRQQTFDEIAMHGAGVAARAVLQHAEAIDHDIDLALADQPRQRGCIHRHDRKLEIGGAGLLRRLEMPRDADRLKTPQSQIIGDEPPDQAGGAEDEDFRDELPRSLPT